MLVMAPELLDCSAKQASIPSHVSDYFITVLTRPIAIRHANRLVVA